MLTRFIFHRGEIVVEIDEKDSPISGFIRGYDVVASDIVNEESREPARYYYQLDEQRSTAFITSETVKVENFYQYDAFGNVLESKERLHNRITYTGQQYDPVTQQYYLRARFYNPILGRFTQEDVYRGDGLNLYAYCGNNPVMYYDPSGYAKNESACGNKGDSMNPGEEKIDAFGKDGSNPSKHKTPYSQLSPKQKMMSKQKLRDRTITQDEYKHLEWDRRFTNRRKRGVDRFWSSERKSLQNGEAGTRNWNNEQKSDIMNKKVPKYNGEPIEGHHKYNAIDYPQIADDPTNIYPATNKEHFERWHGGNYQNDTNGIPNNNAFKEEF